MRKLAPILEFDSTPVAIIEPVQAIQGRDLPEHCVVCFFPEVIEKVVSQNLARVVFTSRWESGKYPIYEMAYKERRLAFYHSGVGSALAAALLEEVIAGGCRKITACGGCGVLQKDIAVGQIILPTSAVRDEGVSYHYVPASREVSASGTALAALEEVLKDAGLPYRKGKTWTTDAPYRETPSKIERRKAEGCITVEMEAAAFFAVAQMRGVHFAQMLYGGDDVSSDEWNERNWQAQTSLREKLFWLAAEACFRI